MFSEKEELLKKVEILKIVNYILDFNENIDEISRELNISELQVLKYLKDENLIYYVGKEKADKIHLILGNQKDLTNVSKVR